jgi:hypothetical protein
MTESNSHLAAPGGLAVQGQEPTQAGPFYTCCEDGMLSKVPPTDRSGLCPACRPASAIHRLSDEELAGHLRSLGTITWRDCWNLAEHLRREGVVAYCTTKARATGN